MTTARVRTIGGLPLAGQLDGSETIPAAQGGASVAITSQKLADRAAQLVPAATKQSVGLGNVDNTPDAQKPVSAPTSAALKSAVPSNFRTVFGGVGDGVTDNAAALQAAKNAGAKRIYLDAGEYLTTRLDLTWDVGFDGPGQIKVRGQNVNDFPGVYSWITTKPVRPSDGNAYFVGDQSKVRPEYFIVNTGLRSGLDERYVEDTTTPHFSFFENRGGNSGFAARLTAPAGIGATSFTLNSVVGLAATNKLGVFSNTGSAENYTDRVTIENISGNVVTFSPPLTMAYAAGDAVTLGVRTMNPFAQDSVFHSAGGDCYARLYRVSASYQPTPGQRTFYETSTAGIDGGDIIAQSDGVFLTNREVSFNDLGHDIAAIGYLQGFNRNNNTGARDAVWIAEYYTSFGTRPIDAVWAFGGTARVGVDLVRGDFSSNGNCAIALPNNGRVFYDNVVSTTKLSSDLYGSVLGTASHGYNKTSATFDFSVGGISAIKTNTTFTEVASLRISDTNLDNPKWTQRAYGGIQSFGRTDVGDIWWMTSGAFHPYDDNQRSFGAAGNRATTIYLGSAPVVSSDENLKSEISDMTDAENAWGMDISKLFVSYKFKDSVAEKGKEARRHIGLIAQRVVDSGRKRGLDPLSYGFICLDELPDGERYSIRYEEALSFAMAGMVMYLENLAEKVEKLSAE